MNKFLQFISAEENRLARLKIFCDAAQINFPAAKEEIAKACNNAQSEGFYLSPQEIQDRYIYYKNHDINCSLGEPYFWELVNFIKKQ